MPTLNLDSCRIDEMYEQVLPLPFVPATWINFNWLLDKLSLLINLFIFSSPGLYATDPLFW